MWPGWRAALRRRTGATPCGADRRHGGFWMALGATAVLFGLLAFLWAVA
jgi:hypothetical protein